MGSDNNFVVDVSVIVRLYRYFKILQLFAFLDRPFEVRYDPYTQMVNVLDNPAKIGRVIGKLQEELSVLACALGKV